jgi:hypothetical protein
MLCRKDVISSEPFHPSQSPRDREWKASGEMTMGPFYKAI